MSALHRATLQTCYTKNEKYKSVHGARIPLLQFVVSAALFTPSIAFAQVQLDVLTECDAVAAIHSQLSEKREIVREACRDPQGDLEPLIAEHLSRFRVKSCFLKDTGHALLRGFSCLSTYLGSQASLTCFRPWSMNSVTRHMEQYKKSGALLAESYGRSAEACEIYWGDVGPAQNVTYPQEMHSISKFEFGFIAPLEESVPTKSSVFHGFGSTDPRIGAKRAVEVISFRLGGEMLAERKDTEEFGDWRLSIDSDDDLERDMRLAFRDAAFSFSFDSETFNISLKYSPSWSRDRLNKAVDLVYDGIKDKLLEELFEDFQPSLEGGFESAWEDALRERMREQVPYGTRDIVDVTADSQMIMMINGSRRVCFGSGEGALLVLLTSSVNLGGRDGVGNVGVGVAAIGNCRRLADPSQQYSQGLHRNIKSVVREALSTINQEER
jgi:hypothetical protein